MSKERLNQELDAVEQRLVQDVSAEPDAKRRAELYRALTTYAEARAQLAQVMPYLPEILLEEAPPVEERQLITTDEQEPPKLYTAPEAAALLGVLRNIPITWIKKGLLEEGVHFIETGGEARVQRRITEQGLARIRKIKEAKADFWRMPTQRVLAKLRGKDDSPTEKRPSTTELVRETLFSRPGRVTKAQAVADQFGITVKAVHNAVRRLKNQVGGHRIAGTQFGYFVRPETEHIKPEQVSFSEEETLKLAHRLSEAARRLKETYDVQISDAVHEMWAQFRDGGGTLQNPEAAVRSLERKLLSLVQDPVTELPRFSENYPVEEVLMLMYQLDPGQRGPFLKSLLYPKNHTFVGRWGQPIERVRKGK